MTKEKRRELRLKTRKLEALICLIGMMPILICLLSFCAYLNAEYPTPKHRTRTPIYEGYRTGWAVDVNGWHYTPKEGPSPVSCWYTIDGYDYYFNNYGYMSTGWVSVDEKLYYFDITGQKQTDMWATDDNNVTYRLNGQGTPVTGWYTDEDGSRYYFDDFGAMQTGWVLLDDKRYHLGEDGKLESGWIKDGDLTYYADDSGEIQTGWLVLDDKTYYLGDDGARKTGLLTVDGSTYYMNGDAVMQTGLVAVNGIMHYFDSKGVMQTGWIESGDARYYFDGDGNAVSGWKNLDSKWCWFDGNGKYDPNRKYDSAPMVALTFDDGPGEYTNQILDLLGKYNVKATFFMIGNQVSDFSSAVKREHDMGMEQGNHSWDHKTLTHLTAEQISSEISRTNDVIRSVTGQAPTLFRPPGGGYNDLVIANSFGMPMIMWSIDTLDWSHKNAQTTYDTVMNSVQDGDIILMHEIYEQSYIAAQMLIPALLERGFRLVTVSELAAQRGHTLRSGISYGRLN